MGNIQFINSIEQKKIQGDERVKMDRVLEELLSKFKKEEPKDLDASWIFVSPMNSNVDSSLISSSSLSPNPSPNTSPPSISSPFVSPYTPSSIQLPPELQKYQPGVSTPTKSSNQTTYAWLDATRNRFSFVSYFWPEASSEHISKSPSLNPPPSNPTPTNISPSFNTPLTPTSNPHPPPSSNSNFLPSNPMEPENISNHSNLPPNIPFPVNEQYLSIFESRIQELQQQIQILNSKIQEKPGENPYVFYGHCPVPSEAMIQRTEIGTLNDPHRSTSLEEISPISEAILPPPPPPSQLPPPPPPGEATSPFFKQANSKKKEEKTREMIIKELHELIAQSEIAASNYKLAQDNFLHTFTEKHTNLLALLVEKYPGLVRKFPLQPKTCFERMKWWEKHLFKKLEENQANTVRKNKTVEIEKLETEAQVIEAVEKTKKVLEYQKQKQEEERANKEKKDAMGALLEELKSIHEREKELVKETKAQEEISTMETGELDLYGSAF